MTQAFDDLISVVIEGDQVRKDASIVRIAIPSYGLSDPQDTISGFRHYTRSWGEYYTTVPRIHYPLIAFRGEFVIYMVPLDGDCSGKFDILIGKIGNRYTSPEYPAIYYAGQFDMGPLWKYKLGFKKETGLSLEEKIMLEAMKRKGEQK